MRCSATRRAPQLTTLSAGIVNEQALPVSALPPLVRMMHRPVLAVCA